MLIDPHISTWMHLKNANDSKPILTNVGVEINLPWKQVTHKNFELKNLLILQWMIMCIFNDLLNNK